MWTCGLWPQTSQGKGYEVKDRDPWAEGRARAPVTKPAGWRGEQIGKQGVGGTGVPQNV